MTGSMKGNVFFENDDFELGAWVSISQLALLDSQHEATDIVSNHLSGTINVISQKTRGLIEMKTCLL